MIKKHEPTSEEEALNKLHSSAMSAYNDASEAWSNIRQEAMEDSEFYFGEQWETEVKTAMLKNGEAAIRSKRTVGCSNPLL